MFDNKDTKQMGMIHFDIDVLKKENKWDVKIPLKYL